MAQDYEAEAAGVTLTVAERDDGSLYVGLHEPLPGEGLDITLSADQRRLLRVWFITHR